MFESSNLSAERKYGVSRTQKLLKLCNSPDLKLKCVHIAGSNGKGSCAAFISHVLLAAKKRVGTFTSPAVYDYFDQFSIDCKTAPNEIVERTLMRVTELASTLNDRPTQFEIETVAALLLFYESGCEYAVIECGLGGIDDATNAIAKKEIAVITGVTLEHTAELGSTIEEICKKKSGIAVNCPLYVSALQCDEALNFFVSFGAYLSGEGLCAVSEDENGQVFEYRGVTYKTSLYGIEQAYNAALATDVCRKLGISDCQILKRGIENTGISGRVERVYSHGKRYILDGGHNPAALAPFTEFIKNYGGNAELIFGCLSDKDINKMTDLLCPLFEKITLVAAPCGRAMSIKKMQEAFNGKAAEIAVAENIATALESTSYQTVAVCGSFTLLKEAKEWIDKKQ